MGANFVPGRSGVRIPLVVVQPAIEFGALVFAHWELSLELCGIEDLPEVLRQLGGREMAEVEVTAWRACPEICPEARRPASEVGCCL